MEDNSPNNNDNNGETEEFNSKQFYLLVIATVTMLLLASTLNNILIKNESNQKRTVSQLKDQSLVFFKKKENQGGHLSVVSNNILEACIYLKASLKNTEIDIETPAILDVNLTPKKPVQLANYTITDKEKPWHFDSTKKWLVGNRGGNPNLEHVYALPFSKDINSKVNQGAHGEFSHNTECDAFAIDFALPEGTPVLAARKGKVIAVRTNSSLHGETKEYAPAANYIVIKHEDGSYAQYYHLELASAKVKLGDQVEAGEQIASSGNTGWTDGPHLHFSVFKIVESNDSITNHSVPVKFETNSGVVENLEAGNIYGHPGTDVQ